MVSPYLPQTPALYQTTQLPPLEVLVMVSPYLPQTPALYQTTQSLPLEPIVIVFI